VQSFMVTSPYRLELGSVLRHKDQMYDLLHEHWIELATDKNLMALAPDWERYAALEELGKLFVIYAYKGDKLIGYSANIVDTHIHYSDLTVCSNDVLFIEKSERGGIGRELMAATREVGKERGAQLMLWHAKPGTALDHVLSAVPVQDIIHSERL
jgi:predicted GNAT superfamily acetyltransferase